MNIDIELIENIAEVLRRVQAIANLSSADDDTGPENTDTPILHLKDWKQGQVDVLRSKAPGLIGNQIRTGIWKGWRTIDLAYNGKASNRTRMAKAVTHYLKENGLVASMNYNSN